MLQTKLNKMNHGKLLRLQDDWSIFIFENEEGEYISPDGMIKYRSIGKNIDIRLVQEYPVQIDANGIVQVFNAVGKPHFHFPMVWLDTTTMKIQRLIELGILKTNNN